LASPKKWRENILTNIDLVALDGVTDDLAAAVGIGGVGVVHNVAWRLSLQARKTHHVSKFFR
jgi:hypothetical protein